MIPILPTIIKFSAIVGAVAGLLLMLFVFYHILITMPGPLNILLAIFVLSFTVCFFAVLYDATVSNALKR
jgi:predicted membrane metal-binding protein